MGADEEARARDNVVIKSPTDRRSYRILHLPNGLCALLVHDPEIFPEGGGASRNPEEDDDALEEEEDDDDDDMEEDEDECDEDDDDDYEDVENGDEEEGDEEGIEKKKKKRKGGAVPTKKAAAAMCVGMGSFSDPSNAQGLAHFLEHMLFMGSSDFPDENEYDSYLSKHGGSSNAYTETEHTCYHFEVNREYLKGALKRFSQFFISPLVKAEAMEREVLAIDSEFNQVLQSDSCRLQQLQCHTSMFSHPFNRFCWGNKKSLVNAMENGVNLREEILKMYKENYHGGMMKLVVIGGESLDILEEWVMELFSNVKTGHQPKMSTRYEAPIWKPGKLYRLEAVKDVHILELSCSLPCLQKEYLKKAEDYISHLMGHEGKGSLLSYLKSKGWASSLAAGVGDDGLRRSSIAFVFVMTVNLTDSGLEKIYEVIGVVYQYIKLLRQSSPQEWIFKELQDIGNMEFRFAEEQPQDDYAAELAENLLFYPEEHIIYGEYAFEQWEPKLIESILSFFSPDNMRIDILSKSFDKKSRAIQYEPWFGSPYIEEDIPSSFLEAWRNPPEIHPSLHFPLKNEFIPCDFSLHNADSSKCHAHVNYPKCIVDQPLVKLWYKIDSTFNVPRANTYFLITVKDGYSSVKSCLLTELFVNLLKDELNEILYQASVAKLETSLSIISDKLELKLYGFNDKLSTLLSNILTLSKTFSPSNDRFQVIKEDMERSYRNSNMRPMNHSTYLRLQVLRETFWDVDDKLACLANLTVADLKAFIPNLLSQLHIEGLCHGNLSEEEAVKISNIFTDIFPVHPLPVELRHQERVLQLPSGANFIRSVRVKNELEANSVVELYFQIEQDNGIKATRLRAITDIFSNIVEEPCFNQLRYLIPAMRHLRRQRAVSDIKDTMSIEFKCLTKTERLHRYIRTKEQLGYVVESSPRMTYRTLGFSFRVQSSEYSPLHLHSRIDNFISDICQLLDELDDESFENHRTGLIAEKLEKDPSLSYETGNYWSQITDKRYLFDMSKLEAEELKTIQKTDVVNLYNTYFRSQSPKCRRLAIHVWGCKADMHGGAQTKGFGKEIDDVDSFKRHSKFYSSLC